MNKFKVGDHVTVVNMHNPRYRLFGLTGLIIKIDESNNPQKYLVQAENIGPLVTSGGMKKKNYYWKPLNITWRAEDELQLD